MPPPQPAFDHASASDLRASLLRSLEPSVVTGPVAVTATVAAQNSSLPSAPELLQASPAIQRLCESYHRIHRHMVARSRRQRLGIAALVAAVGISAVMISRSNQVAAETLSSMVLAVAGMSCLGLGLLAFLWVRDNHRLRDAQGERLLRALQFNCGLPEQRLLAFRRFSQPTAAFFDCYHLWRADHPDRSTGLTALFGNIVNPRRRAAV